MKGNVSDLCDQIDEFEDLTISIKEIIGAVEEDIYH